MRIEQVGFAQIGLFLERLNQRGDGMQSPQLTNRFELLDVVRNRTNAGCQRENAKLSRCLDDFPVGVALVNWISLLPCFPNERFVRVWKAFDIVNGRF
jgi:hypothetical protein